MLCVSCTVAKERGSKANLHAHNTGHGTVHTKIATKQVPRFRIVAKCFLCCKFRYA